MLMYGVVTTTPWGCRCSCFYSRKHKPWLPRTRSASRVKWSVLVSIYCMCLWTKKLNCTLAIDLFSNIYSRTSCRIYRLDLPPQMSLYTKCISACKIWSLKSAAFYWRVYYTMDCCMRSNNWRVKRARHSSLFNRESWYIYVCVK